MSMQKHFFKVVVFPPEHGLKIPIAFMQRYGHDLQKIVQLKVPTGKSWKVELVNRDNRTWLQKGWQEVAEFYSIKIGYFVVFRYEGNSQFHVTIFDHSTTEIEYPSENISASDDQMEGDASAEMFNRGSKGNGLQQEMEDLEDDTSVEILSDDDGGVKPRMISEGNTKKMKRLLRSASCSKQKIKSHNKEKGSYGTDQRHSQPTIYAKDGYISYQRAKAFRSEKPFFIAFMQPSYVSASCTLSIPLRFTKKYLTFEGKEECKLSLRVEGRKQTWTAICRPHIANAKISGGWSDFVQQNSLNVGDVCVFELESANAFNTIIYRA